MALALILVGLGITAITIGLVVEKHRSRNAAKNGNGFDRLEEYARTCKCKGAD
jgi:hypothetical protein